jgi:DNA-binding GntR family transcriptional regulator
LTTLDPQPPKFALDPVDVSTVQERVYQSLRLALLKGQFLPGEQVSIRNLAQALGTSAMPVREAVRRLVSEKAFEQSTDRLLRVAPYVAAEHEEYIRIRMQLEGYATERAALAETPDMIDALRQHNEAMLRALRARDFESALAANQAFHFEIYRAARSPQLLDIVASLWLRTGPILAASRNSAGLFERLFEIGYKVHAEAIEAIARKDRVAARRAVNLDIRAAHLSIRRALIASEADGPMAARLKRRR